MSGAPGRTVEEWARTTFAASREAARRRLQSARVLAATPVLGRPIRSASRVYVLDLCMSVPAASAFGAPEVCIGDAQFGRMEGPTTPGPDVCFCELELGWTT